jgi:hypothetical protein
MMSAVASCTNSVIASSAVDRLKPDAAAHASALAGDDVPAMRETGLVLIARLSAFAGWKVQ